MVLVIQTRLLTLSRPTIDHRRFSDSRLQAEGRPAPNPCSYGTGVVKLGATEDSASKRWRLSCRSGRRWVDLNGKAKCRTWKLAG